MLTVDARGLSCPEPALIAKRTLEKAASGSVNVLVDEMAACENVTALAKSMGWQVTSKSTSTGIELNLRR